MSPLLASVKRGILNLIVKCGGALNITGVSSVCPWPSSLHGAWRHQRGQGSQWGKYLDLCSIEVKGADTCVIYSSKRIGRTFCYRKQISLPMIMHHNISLGDMRHAWAWAPPLTGYRYVNSPCGMALPCMSIWEGALVLAKSHVQRR